MNDRTRLFNLTSALLTYPDSRLLTAGAELRAEVAKITHPAIRECLTAFLDWFLTTDPLEVETHYVRTFDLRRRSGLYLTYYLHGDTRKRGIALLTLKQRYRAHGLHLADGELPDLLPVMLEFAALAGPGDGEAPLRQHRRGVELLRVALTATESPYRHLLDAIDAALPPLTDSDREAVRALAEDGPPVESVGLAPYGAPGFDPPCTPHQPVGRSLESAP
jgi:nitrate reductase molybdenum cofactor assembly chaperone NarJ/NarW